ncbi:hypothetical protein EV174_006945, partial [Coemansia sp. RSA 2320]
MPTHPTTAPSPGIALQAAFAAAMGGTMRAGAQFGAAVPQHMDQHGGISATSQMLAMSHAHSRSTSVVDGAVAMYSNDGSNIATPHSGI